MTKKQLETEEIDGGMRLVAEPVYCCGHDTFEGVTHLRRGLTYLLRGLMGDGSLNGNVVEIPADLWWDINAVWDTLDEATDFIDGYLKRRIEALEADLGLSHNRDINV